MSKDILNTEMNSGTVYDKEEKMSRTQVIEKLLEAGECVLTVHFNKKVDDKHVKEILSKTNSNTDLKKLSKEIVIGKECEMTCYLTSSDNQLGRSSVIDLNAPHGMNFRQIDHRTINWMVLRNVKYVVK